uniref:Uncharacterized protein n=2 Tax=Anguilla anguilla TaxID=7936 RepID=A0A0E9PML5_ANGAN
MHFLVIFYLGTYIFMLCLSCMPKWSHLCFYENKLFINIYIDT